jgi:hypothetical protein
VTHGCDGAPDPAKVGRYALLIHATRRIRADYEGLALRFANRSSPRFEMTANAAAARRKAAAKIHRAFSTRNPTAALAALAAARTNGHRRATKTAIRTIAPLQALTQESAIPSEGS